MNKWKNGNKPKLYISHFVSKIVINNIFLQAFDAIVPVGSILDHRARSLETLLLVDSHALILFCPSFKSIVFPSCFFLKGLYVNCKLWLSRHNSPVCLQSPTGGSAFQILDYLQVSLNETLLTIILALKMDPLRES